MAVRRHLPLAIAAAAAILGASGAAGADDDKNSHQATTREAPPLSAAPACWSDSVALADKQRRNCLTADTKTAKAALAALDDLPRLRISCCDGAAPRFVKSMLPATAPPGLVQRWTARMADHSLLMVDGYDSPAAAQQAANYGGAIADRAEAAALGERYQQAVAAMGDRAPPARARIDSVIATLQAGAYPLPGDRGRIALQTRCFSMAVTQTYVLCNAYLPGSVAVITTLRQTHSTDAKVTKTPVQLLDSLLAAGAIKGSLPATPPP